MPRLHSKYLEQKFAFGIDTKPSPGHTNKIVTSFVFLGVVGGTVVDRVGIGLVSGLTHSFVGSGIVNFLNLFSSSLILSLASSNLLVQVPGHSFGSDVVEIAVVGGLGVVVKGGH